MVKECSGKATEALSRHGFIPEGESEAYAFGIQTGIETAIGIASTLAIGFLLGMALESAIFLIAYSSVRTFAGGYHADTFLKCFVSSCLLVAAVLMFIAWFPQRYLLAGNVFFLIASMPVIWHLSPVAATHKPLDEEETVCFRRKCRARLLLECIIVLILLLLGQQRIAMVISTGLAVLSILMICGKLQARKMQA